MNIGVYIHIPFCETKCNYCHFVTRPMHSATAENYCNAVIREIRLTSSEREGRDAVDTIYFGGGTPSIVPAEQVERLLQSCREVFGVSPDCEITLEANPGSLTTDKVDCYRHAGINRISLGAQTFDDPGLASIGRDHTGNQITESINMLRAGGIQNISLDLMLGLPGQDEARWRADLDKMSLLLPDHLSVYMLDLHERSPLYHSVTRGQYELPEDDLVADLYLVTIERLSRLGYDQYEISNFALAGRRSRHNLKYWKREPVLGFGVGSHSYDGAARYANYSRMSEYLRSVEERGTAVEWRRVVQAQENLEETLFLGLRLNEGLDWRRLRFEFGETATAPFDATLRQMSERGLLDWRDSVVRLTPEGMLLSNEVFSEFV